MAVFAIIDPTAVAKGVLYLEFQKFITESFMFRLCLYFYSCTNFFDKLWEISNSEFLSGMKIKILL